MNECQPRLFDYPEKFHLKDQDPKMLGRIVVALLTALFLASLFGTLAGCSTVEGLGKDIKAGGTAIKDEAREIKKQI